MYIIINNKLIYKQANCSWILIRMLSVGPCVHCLTLKFERDRFLVLKVVLLNLKFLWKYLTLSKFVGKVSNLGKKVPVFCWHEQEWIGEEYFSFTPDTV